MTGLALCYRTFVIKASFRGGVGGVWRRFSQAKKVAIAANACQLRRVDAKRGLVASGLARAELRSGPKISDLIVSGRTQAQVSGLLRSPARASPLATRPRSTVHFVKRPALAISAAPEDKHRLTTRSGCPAPPRSDAPGPVRSTVRRPAPAPGCRGCRSACGWHRRAKAPGVPGRSSGPAR